ncbi:MAG: hypothetical protein E7532_00410 [Ruminococcaceae bacterium]|nr:hypothetical protein [Oscillospiraceae bacterium]
MERKLFLKILESSLHSAPFVSSEGNREQWLNVFRLAEIHKVLPLVVDASLKVCPPDTDELPSFIKKTKLMVTGQVIKSAAFLNLCKLLTEENIRFLTLKGIVCRQVYPKPDLRISGDEDLFVCSEDFAKITDVLKKAGFFSVKPDTDGIEETFTDGKGLFVEVHKALFDKDNGYFDKFNALFDSVFDNPFYLEVASTKIPTLHPEMHLLYLILHCAKHFFHSGVGIRQVSDILMFYRFYKSSINLENVIDTCRCLSLDKFAAAIFDIGDRYLGFEKPDIADIDSDMLLEDILDAGVYGSSSLSRQHSAGITLSAVKGKRKGALGRIFPSSKELGSGFTYAKKHPVLLPVAWGHRLMRYSSQVSKTAENSPKDTLSLGKKRVELMKHYGMIPESEVKK